MRRFSVVLAMFGTLLVAAAVIVGLVVLPSMSKLPADLAASQEFQGSFSGLNQAGLASGDPTKAFVQGLPVTASSGIKVDRVDGDTGYVTMSTQLTVAGQKQPATSGEYTVSRVDLRSVGAPAGAAIVVPNQTVIFTFPQHPSRDSGYHLWDVATKAAYPVAYRGTSELAGRTVYEYTSTATGSIADPATFGLPAALPKTTLVTLAPVLSQFLPAALLAQLPAALSQLPERVALAYTSSTETTLWVDSELGVPLKVRTVQKINGNLDLGQKIAIPFSTTDLTSTDGSTRTVASTVKDDSRTLALFGVVLPIALAVIGAFLLLCSVVAAVRGRRRSPGLPSTDTEPIVHSIVR